MKLTDKETVAIIAGCIAAIVVTDLHHRRNVSHELLFHTLCAPESKLRPDQPMKLRKAQKTYDQLKTEEYIFQGEKESAEKIAAYTDKLNKLCGELK